MVFSRVTSHQSLVTLRQRRKSNRRTKPNHGKTVRPKKLTGMLS